MLYGDVLVLFCKCQNVLLCIKWRSGIAARERVAISVATKTWSYRGASLNEFPCDKRRTPHAGKNKEQ